MPCNTTYKLGCFNYCEDVTIPIDIGIYQLVIKSPQGISKQEVISDGAITLPKLNENMEYEFHLNDLNGDLVEITYDNVIYNSFSYKIIIS